MKTAGKCFAVAGALVFDGERVRENHAVLLGDGVVDAVAPRHALPPGVETLDYPGCAILPGLIDSHVHFMRWEGPQFLAHGVTTVRDTGNVLDWILARRDEGLSLPWPRILCMGPILDGPKPTHELICRACPDLPGAIAAVRATCSAGVDGIKLYVGLPDCWLEDMADAGHEAGRKVSMHCSNSVLVAAEAGVDEFYHLDGVINDFWPGHPPGWLGAWGMPGMADTAGRREEVAFRLRDTGIVATPTLAYWDSQWRVRSPDSSAREIVRSVPAPITQWQAPPVNGADSDLWKGAMRAAVDFVGQLLGKGVPVLAGTDTPCGPVPAGLGLWTELSLLAEAGMTPLQAIRAATSGAAAFLGRPDLGRLAAGSAADLVVVEGNPFRQIPSRPRIRKVIRNGVVFDPENLLSAGGSGQSLDDEPWARQFEKHWQARGGDR